MPRSCIPPLPAATFAPPRMTKYPDLIERIFLHPDLLKKLTPSEPLNWTLPTRIAEADDVALLGDAPVADRAMLNLVRGGLLYGIDALDPAHRIFQDEPGDIGSYWHGMAHRREGDFDNARYWFRRAGRLPFFPRLHRVAAEHCALSARQMSWDPYLFTGECEQARFGASEELPRLVSLQHAEFEVLLNYCWRLASGAV